jgi:hypothetical protein
MPGEPFPARHDQARAQWWCGIEALGPAVYFTQSLATKFTPQAMLLRMLLDLDGGSRKRLDEVDNARYCRLLDLKRSRVEDLFRELYPPSPTRSKEVPRHGRKRRSILLASNDGRLCLAPPRVMLWDATIPASAKVLYAFIRSHKNSGNDRDPSVATLAKETDRSVDSVRLDLRFLKTAGYIAITQRKVRLPDGSVRNFHHYELLWHATFAAQVAGSAQPVPPTAPAGRIMSPTAPQSYTEQPVPPSAPAGLSLEHPESATPAPLAASTITGISGVAPPAQLPGFPGIKSTTLPLGIGIRGLGDFEKGKTDGSQSSYTVQQPNTLRPSRSLSDKQNQPQAQVAKHCSNEDLELARMWIWKYPRTNDHGHDLYPAPDWQWAAFPPDDIILAQILEAADWSLDALTNCLRNLKQGKPMEGIPKPVNQPGRDSSYGWFWFFITLRFHPERLRADDPFTARRAPSNQNRARNSPLKPDFRCKFCGCDRLNKLGRCAVCDRHPDLIRGSGELCPEAKELLAPLLASLGGAAK